MLGHVAISLVNSFWILFFIFLFTGLVAIFTCLTGYKFFVSTVTYWNRWDYSNPGYLDALKHITDLKEQGKNCILFPDE